MAGLVEPGQPLDVEMEEIAQLLPLVAPDRRLGREACDLAEVPWRISSAATVEQARPSQVAISAAVSRQWRKRRISCRSPRRCAPSPHGAATGKLVVIEKIMQPISYR